MSELFQGFQTVLQPEYLLLALLGAVLGTAVGVLPGLGPAVTISLLLPVTFALGDPVGAFILFGGIFYGGMYGGSTTSILLNVPGETASVVTTIDGHQMALHGRGGAALMTAAIGSFIAGAFATLALALVARPLVDVAIGFGPVDYLALMLLALALVSTLGGHPLKSAAMVILGLILSTVGIDFQTGQERFTFGSLRLGDGIDFVIAAIGLFAISEVLLSMTRERNDTSHLVVAGKIHMTAKEWRRSAAPWARGSVIGFFVGVLPGAGASVASFISYGIEKTSSPFRREMGKGAIEGVAGPEAANNASAGGSMLPLLVLGIPGSATTAVMLAAFQGYGITTGPLLFQENGELVWAIIASLFLGNVMLLVLNLPLISVWVQLLKVPPALLNPMIVVISGVGVYSLNRSSWDLLLLVILGVLGLVLRRNNFPLAPLILGLILGSGIETQLRRALIGSDGDWSVFLSSPLATSVMVLAAILLLAPLLLSRLGRSLAEDGELEVTDETTESHEG